LSAAFYRFLEVLQVGSRAERASGWQSALVLIRHLPSDRPPRSIRHVSAGVQYRQCTSHLPTPGMLPSFARR